MHTHIDRCIVLQRSIWVRYDGGSKPGSWREIRPLRWEPDLSSRLLLVRALAMSDNAEKVYALDRITHIALERPADVPDDRAPSEHDGDGVGEAAGAAPRTDCPG